MLSFGLVFVFFMLVGALLIMVSLLSLSKFWREGMVSPIESGFSSYKTSSLPFSMQFFMVLLIFVLFDVEVIFLVYTPFTSQGELWSLVLFFSFVYGTLFYEWKVSKLIWF